MDKQSLHKHVPTVMTYLEKRRAAKKNQLPKHLRPLPIGPIFIHMALNLAIFAMLCYLMLNRDEFMTEAAPAMGLVVTLMLLIYSLISSFQLKRRHAKTTAARWTRLNQWLMWWAALWFPIAIAYFL